MKSNSDVRPVAILPLGNGAYHYNYNVTARTAEPEPVPQSNDENTEGVETAVAVVSPRIVYDYNTVEVWGNPDYKDLTRAVIRAEVSETEEFGLINDYNAARAGLLDDEEAEKAEAAYTAHLRRVAEIKAMVKVDLAGSGY
ncbi:MAG: hypothetical protein HDS69_02385 [Bacteroidales bacterium]|nr:hypothetical protein [Bacteroidales bacterium]